MTKPVIENIGDKSLDEHPFFIALRKYIANKIVRELYQKEYTDVEEKWNQAKEDTNNAFKVLLIETDDLFPGSEYGEDIISRAFFLNGKRYYFKYNPGREFDHNKVNVIEFDMFEKPTS